MSVERTRLKSPLEIEHRPVTPPPTADTPLDGASEARALAKRYMVDAVKLLAGVAFSPDSEAALHTRVVACKQLIDVAGLSPPPPSAPSVIDSGGGNGAGAA
jgi:hypothetical protein